MKFCDKVKKERRAKGLTQQQFADMLGVSLRTITNYEKGESYPKQREIYGKMAEILGVDINYLLTENEEFYINANEKYGATGAQRNYQSRRFLLSQLLCRKCRRKYRTAGKRRI